jgi:hypothetical protein
MRPFEIAVTVETSGADTVGIADELLWRAQDPGLGA